MQLTKGAIGNLINRYKAVLKKCHLLNVFGSLAVAGMLVMGGAGVAGAAITTGQGFKGAVTNAKPGDTITLGQDIKEGVGAVFTGKTVTVDFGGHTYTGYSDSVGSKGTETQLFQLLKDSPAVTLKNGILNIATSPAESGKFKMVLQNYCDLTLDNMVVDGTNLLGDGTYTMSNNHGDITINNSTIIAKEGGVALDAYYSNDYADGVSVTVNNSTITGKIEVTVDGKEELQDGAKHQLTLTGGTLTGGLRAEQGAQLYNEGTTVISDVTMAGNIATEKGGAIFNSDDKTGAKGNLTLNNVDLKGNKAAQGGAIYNKGTLTVNGGSFTDNSAAPDADGSTVTVSNVGGAIYNADDATLSIDGTRFEGNTAAIAGAVNNQYDSSRITGITNAVFVNNTASLSAGGALRNQGTIDSIAGTTFEGNTAGNGGALWNGAGGTIASITDTTFTGNKSTDAAVGGGAITNAGEITKINATTFTDNSAAGNGGAINNVKGGTASITLSDTTFTGNTADKLGGAIYNAGKLTFNGTNTFSGNTAAEGKDIYNSGTLIMTSDSHLIVDGNQNIYNANGATLTVESGAKLTITDAVAGGNYEVVTGVGKTTIDKGAWSGDNLQSSSDMVVLTSTDGKTFTAEGRDAHDVFTGLDDSMGDAVNSLYARHGAAGTNGWNYADVNAEERGIRFLSRATDKRFIGADHQAAAATIESAARIAFAGAVPQMTKMASDAASNAVVNRLGFANPADGAQAMDAEGKIVDRNTTGFALWIAPLWQSQHGWGMEADSMDYGFNGNLGGVSLGADYTFENAIRAGITFNIGGGYAESSGGDLNSTENNMSFWGLGAYAGWNYENFGLMADVSYTSTWNDLKQDLDSRMGMGDLEADVQASAISAGLRAEYKLETSVLDIIPHIGVRYMSLNTWGYDVDADGGTVLEGDGFHQDIWTFPVGVTFSKDITLDSGWFFKPSVDFSVIPAAGDIKAKSEVAFTGLPGTYEVETQMMDYLTWQGGVGLEMGNDTMSFGVNYTLQAGQHTTGHGVFGSFRYEF